MSMVQEIEILFTPHDIAELSMGWVDTQVGLGWAGLGRESETFPKILKLGRPLVTAEVISDNLIMINADK